MSPARSHVEQSRNTLLFASCAKEVTTNAQVNVVMSDKALVKHLQRELARMENELRSSAPSFLTSNFSELLQEKDLHIEKVKNLAFNLRYGIVEEVMIRLLMVTNSYVYISCSWRRR